MRSWGFRPVRSIHTRAFLSFLFSRVCNDYIYRLLLKVLFWYGLLRQIVTEIACFHFLMKTDTSVCCWRSRCVWISVRSEFERGRRRRCSERNGRRARRWPSKECNCTTGPGSRRCRRRCAMLLLDILACYQHITYLLNQNHNLTYKSLQDISTIKASLDNYLDTWHFKQAPMLTMDFSHTLLTITWKVVKNTINILYSYVYFFKFSR